ncbi:hypothetical protein L1887_32264 [Cichorium endivia]|nr:hypothetical protein L1887_32264 [Cichorium endivia]
MEGSIIVSLPTEQFKGTNPGHPDNHYPLPDRNHLPTNQSDQTACYNRISNSREHDAVSRRGPDTPDQHEVSTTSQHSTTSTLNTPSDNTLSLTEARGGTTLNKAQYPVHASRTLVSHVTIACAILQLNQQVASSPQPGVSPSMLCPFYTKTRLSRSHYCQGPKLKRNTIAQRSPRPNGNNQNSHGGDHASLAWPRSLSLCNAYHLQQLH